MHPTLSPAQRIDLSITNSAKDIALRYVDTRLATDSQSVFYLQAAVEEAVEDIMRDPCEISEALLELLNTKTIEVTAALHARLTGQTPNLSEPISLEPLPAFIQEAIQRSLTYNIAAELGNLALFAQPGTVHQYNDVKDQNDSDNYGDFALSPAEDFGKFFSTERGCMLPTHLLVRFLEEKVEASIQEVRDSARARLTTK